MIDPAIPRTYFAAANSARGFINYFAPCFSEDRCERLYIIKGGPGTGKSHLMRTIAGHARRAGYEVTTYACSSDATSLDGVLFRRDGQPGVGFVDGTPPHVFEPRLPGVRESILDLGAFWNGDALWQEREAIRHLTEAKSKAYNQAYALLHAAGEVDRVVDAVLSPCLRPGRIKSLTERFLRPLPVVKQPLPVATAPLPALRRALSMGGAVTLHSYEAEIAASGGTIVHLEDYYGIAATLLGAVLASSLARGITPTVSYDPLCPDKVDGLLYSAANLCILSGGVKVPEGSGGTLRSVSIKRLVDPIALREVRGDVRRLITRREALLQDALGCLSEASNHHFELESIYQKAMDFDAVTTLTEQLCARLFSE